MTQQNPISAIPDIQSTPDLRNMPINQVGIKDLRFPISVKTRDGEQNTIAHWTMTVFLPADVKGTHMSRFVALLEEKNNNQNNQNNQAFDFNELKNLVNEMLSRLHSHSGKIKLAFPFFRRKTAPVSGIQSFLDYDVEWTGEIREGEYSSLLKVMIPVTSLCPCSKEISQYGAHNQRSYLTVSLKSSQAVEVEEIIDWVESIASSPLYGLLKRPDEKFVTEKAYENPKFVEDMVRDVAVILSQDKRIQAFEVESENFESIHNHSAYAYISYP